MAATELAAPQKVQCALYQCAAPSPVPSSSADDDPRRLLPFYDGALSSELSPMAEDYRGDCLLFVERDTTFASLLGLLQARLNEYMILHGASPPLRDAMTTPATAGVTSPTHSEETKNWPWCRRCHDGGASAEENGPADIAQTSPHGRSEHATTASLVPSLFVRHVHRLDQRSDVVSDAQLLKRCVPTTRTQHPHTPRYAVYFCLALLPRESGLRDALHRPLSILAPLETSSTASSSSAHFLHIKAAGHVVRASIDSAESTVAALVQTTAARRYLEVTRVVAEQEPHRPAIFPCERASVVARALPYARVVVNKRAPVKPPLERSTSALHRTRLHWRYGDVSSVIGSALPAEAACVRSPQTAPASVNQEGDVRRGQRAPPLPSRDEPVHYYGPYADLDGGEAGETRTIISYSSFSTLTGDGSDGISPFQVGLEDARISLGTLNDVTGFSSSGASCASSPSRGDDGQSHRDATCAQAVSRIDEEEAFITSLNPSEIYLETALAEEPVEVSDSASGVDQLVPSDASLTTSLARTPPRSEASLGGEEDADDCEDDDGVAYDSGGESSSEERDAQLTAPLAPAFRHSQGRGASLPSDALWNLNNDFVFEVDDSSPSPARVADAVSSSPAKQADPGRSSVAVSHATSPSSASKTDTSPSARTQRKPRLVVISSPASYRHSHSGGGSSGQPTPAHQPRPFRPESASTPLRWHFAQRDPATGLFGVPSKDFGLPPAVHSRDGTASSAGSAQQTTPGGPPSASASAQTSAEVIAIVGDPTVSFSQMAASAAPSQLAEAMEGDRLGATATRKRVRSSSPDANVLDETPIAIALHQQTREMDSAERLSAPLDTRVMTPRTVPQPPRHRSPILLSPGDLAFADSSSSSVRGATSNASGVPLSPTDRISAAPVSPQESRTPHGAVAFLAAGELLLPSSGVRSLLVGNPVPLQSQSTAQRRLFSDAKDSTATHSVDDVDGDSSIAQLHHVAPARRSSTVMVTQQAIPDYTQPDGYPSSSDASSAGSDSRSDAVSGDEGDANSNDEARNTFSEGDDGEGSDASDNSDYVFTGL